MKERLDEQAEAIEVLPGARQSWVGGLDVRIRTEDVPFVVQKSECVAAANEEKGDEESSHVGVLPCVKQWGEAWQIFRVGR